MPCFDWRVETDYRTFKVYRTYAEYDLEHGAMKHRKVLEQKCGCMAEALAFILDYERNASIECRSR